MHFHHKQNINSFLHTNVHFTCLICTLQVVSQYSNLLAPITVDAVLRVIDPSTADNVNLKDIRVVQKLGYVLNLFQTGFPSTTKQFAILPQFL